MPNDINVLASSLSSQTPAEAVTRTETAPAAAAAISPKSTASPSAALFANPTLQLNADLGIVVIEFRNGSVTNQIPSQRQLDAYIAGSAQVPGGAPHPAATTPATSSAASSNTSSATSFAPVSATSAPAATAAAPAVVAIAAPAAAAASNATPAPRAW